MNQLQQGSSNPALQFNFNPASNVAAGMSDISTAMNALSVITNNQTAQVSSGLTCSMQTVKERKLMQRNLSWQNYCGS